MTTRSVAFLLVVALAGCGGGAATPAQQTTTATQSNAAGANAQIDTTIVVPGAQSAQSSGRSAQYISPSTLGLKVTVTDVPPTGSVASFTATTTTYALSTGNNNIVIPTPASATGHSEDLTYVAYNAAPVANAIPTSAKALAYGITTGFVVMPGQNSSNVVLAGVADSFAAPLAETGAFGMMSASPPTLAGPRVSYGIGGNATPNGSPVVFDAGASNIMTASGGPWPLVGAVPAVATTVGTGVPLTIVETAGTCGSVGTGPHLKLTDNGGVPAITSAIASTTDSIAADYDGAGGVGWYAIVSAKAQSQTLTYTLSSLGAMVPGTVQNSADFSCANQTLSFSQANETIPVTIVEHSAAQPYTVTVPATTACSQLVNVYTGSTANPANLINDGTPTSLGTGSTLTIQLQPTPGGATTCNIEIQDANAAAGATGGAAFPGGTTYVAALLPSAEFHIIVP
jgi:hypothetical protein